MNKNSTSHKKLVSTRVVESVNFHVSGPCQGCGGAYADSYAFQIRPQGDGRQVIRYCPSCALQVIECIAQRLQTPIQNTEKVQVPG